jgi:hypothetical protein
MVATLNNESITAEIVNNEAVGVLALLEEGTPYTVKYTRAGGQIMLVVGKPPQVLTSIELEKWNIWAKLKGADKWIMDGSNIPLYCEKLTRMDVISILWKASFIQEGRVSLPLDAAARIYTQAEKNPYAMDLLIELATQLGRTHKMIA